MAQYRYVSRSRRLRLWGFKLLIPSLLLLLAVACGGLDTLEGDLGALGEVQLRDGSSSSSLDGSTVSGEIVVYVEEHNRITKVEFYLDDPEVKGAPFKAFSSPPYEAVIDTRTLEDGTHTFTALVFVGKGKKAHVVENATFTVANHESDDPGEPEEPPAEPDLTVEAQGDTHVTLPDAAALKGAVEVQGIDPETVTIAWRLKQGPGEVAFADASALETTAHFSAPGSYELELTASSGELSDSDQLSVTVEEGTAEPGDPEEPGDPSDSYQPPCPEDGVAIKSSTSRYRNDSVGEGTRFNACEAVINIDKPVTLQNGSDMHWVGGDLIGSLPEDSSWDEWHSSWGIYVKNVPNAVIEGVRVHGVGDGIRFRDHTENWVLRNCYFSQTGDDAVENDSLYSGLVDDCLFDGTYVGFSARLSASDEGQFDGSDKVWTIQNTLMWLRPQEGVYKGDSPGHGGFFKWDKDGYGPKLVLRNNIFRVDQLPNHNTLTLNPEGKVIESENNIIVWLGKGDYPEPIPEGWTLTTDIRVWEEARDAWLARHPHFNP